MSAPETAVPRRISAEATPPSGEPAHKLRDYHLPGGGNAFGLNVSSVAVLLVLW